MTLKKNALSLMIAGALGLSAPHALASDIGGYGRLDVGLQFTDLDVPDTDGNDSNLDVVGLNSRFGFKGSEDLGNGVTAVYRFEFRVLADDTTIPGSNRLSYVGFASEVGTLTIGRQWSSQYNHLGTFLDPTLYVGTGYAGIDSGLFALRQSDMVKYASVAGAVRFEIDLRADGSGGGDENIDEYQAHGTFDAGALQVAAGVRNVVALTGSDTTHVGAAGSIDIGKAATVRGGLMFVSDNTSDSGMLLGANATVIAGGGLSFMVGADFFDDNDGNQATGFRDFKTLFGGVYKQHSKRTRVYGELRFEDHDQDNTQSETILYGAIRHDF